MLCIFFDIEPNIFLNFPQFFQTFIMKCHISAQYQTSHHFLRIHLILTNLHKVQILILLQNPP